MAVKNLPSKYLVKKNENLNKKTAELQFLINQLLGKLNKSPDGKIKLEPLLSKPNPESFLFLYKSTKDLVREIEHFIFDLENVHRVYRRSNKLKHEFPSDFISNSTSTRNLKRKLIDLKKDGNSVMNYSTGILSSIQAENKNTVLKFESPASTVSKFSKAQMMKMSPEKIQQQFGFEIGMAFFLWLSFFIVHDIGIIRKTFRWIIGRA